MALKHVLFIQRLPHKAGAQTCLARVLKKLQDENLAPILLISKEGWLTEECEKNHIRILRIDFPSSRSVSGYLFQNHAFTKRVKKHLEGLGITPPVVQGNDHPEALRTLHLAHTLNAKCSLMLRTPSMTRSDYFKYRCDRSDLIMVESPQLKDAIRPWDSNRRVVVVDNGLGDDEFLPPRNPSPELSRVLVLGNPSPRKGWQDVVEALEILEDRNDLPFLTLDFTGVRPPDLRTSRSLKKFSINFIGHDDQFKELALRYDLVLNASRGETFGMAPLEVIAAGVPLLSSRTGVIERVMDNDKLLFAPHNPPSLANAFAGLVKAWGVLDFDLAGQQEKIRRQFHIDGTVNLLLAEFEKLMAKA